MTPTILFPEAVMSAKQLVSTSAVALVAALSACSGRGETASHVTLTSTLAPLQAAFNADSGKVRAIFLASPVCGECLNGATKLQSAWLAKDTSTNIAVFVVWSPQLGAEEKHVAGASGLMPGPRVHHFWDPNELAGKAYQPMLKLSEAAWDTWMVFDKNAMWRDGAPPTPAWWEHQLDSGPPNLLLDPARFAAHAEALQLVNADHR
ncbi:MAG: hypothetical protein ACREL4_10755 [Gemmatimonadales bacterium]